MGFDHTISYKNVKENVVANSLSRMYEDDGEVYLPCQFIIKPFINPLSLSLRCGFALSIDNRLDA